MLFSLVTPYSQLAHSDGKAMDTWSGICHMRWTMELGR